jgi:hypothetical protein
LPPISPQRARLGRRLREVRAAVFPSGAALARHLAATRPDSSWHQTKVSKLERGEQRPSDNDLAEWLEAADASVDVVEELGALLAAARIEYATVRQLFRRHGGAVEDQASIRTLEAQATRVAEFQPAMVPGLAQTAEYAREVLSLPVGPAAFGASAADIEAMVSERIRRQEILYQPGKQVQLIMGEAALHHRFGPLETLIGQLDRLAAIAGLATVELSVLPFATPLPVFPLGTFDLHDNNMVFIETLSGEQRLDEPEEVSLYVRFLDLLRDTAVTGRDAVTLIRRIMAELRG